MTMAMRVLAGHAPIIFYNVPNWYSGGWDQVRYSTPYDAFAVEWSSRAPRCKNGNPQEILKSVQIYHSSGYEDGDLYYATEDFNDWITCNFYLTQGYKDLAVRYANCGNPSWSAPRASHWAGSVCPDQVMNPDKNRGEPIPPCPKCGDPISPMIGNKFETITLYEGDGEFPLDFFITYNNMYGNSSTQLYNELTLGARRIHSYLRTVRLESNSQAASAYVLRPDGKVYAFDEQGTNWVGDPDVNDRLSATYGSDGSIAGWIYKTGDGVTETYDAGGRLLSLQNRSGASQVLSYDAQGRLQSVSDSKNRSIILSYDAKGRISGLEDPAGAVYTFSYDSHNNLASIEYPDSTSIQFIYGENDGSTNFAGSNDLTGVMDEAGVRVDTTKYDNSDRAYYNSGPNNIGQYTFSYQISHGVSDSYSMTSPLGSTEVVGIKYLNGVALPSSMQAACQGCVTQNQSYTFDGLGHVVSYTDPNGDTLTYAYDAAGLLTQRMEASGLPSQRTANTIWNDDLRVPLEHTMTDALGSVVAKTTWVYNTRGQPLARCEINATSAPSYSCAVSGGPPVGVRRVNYTYCDTVDGTQCPIVGLLLTATGSRTDLTQITSYSYYTDNATGGCATPGGACHQSGDLYQITDPLGHVTTYASYDADGRVTRITDANGVNTDFAYTPRGWLASRSVAGATTTFGYTPYGAVQSVTDPDGVVTTFTYDAAHRLTDITDAQGNYIHYTLDAAGNKTKEEIFDSTGTTHYSQSKTFNALGQLTTIVDGLNHTVFNASTSGDYDANGNLLHSADALGVQTQRSYDALNRLVSTIRDYNGTDTSTKNSTTTVAYDALDRVTGVSDPNSLVTSYTYDGLGDLTHLQSPDTGLSGGSSGDVFDAAGNLTQHTDARGVVTQYTYDALNRLTAKTYPAHPALNATYTYDQAAPIAGCSTNDNIGHLTTMTDASGSTSWCYTAQGDIGQVRQIINGVSYLQSFTYTPGRRLRAQQYPSGFTLSYSYDSDGRVATVGYYQQPGPYGSYTDSTVRPLITAVSYLPFGPMSGYSWAEGSQYVQRTYDLNYALTDITGSALNLHFLRDAKGRMAAEGDTAGASPANESYQSDALDRLTQLTDASGTTEQAFSYNLTGDRLSKTVAGQTTSNYGYQSGTHQLTLVGNAPRTVDADGNTTSILTPNGTQVQLVYDDRNLLTQVLSGGNPIANYQYNGQGIRVWRTITSPSTGQAATVYDPLDTGNLYGEYFAADYREYVYLNGIPVASAMDAGLQAPGISYLHTDGLGSVRVATTTTGADTDQWPWLDNAFGDKAMNGSSSYYLRFPGQYYDVETGLHYNGARYYDSNTGRYIQSDPIGLKGGVNTYAYVGGGPLLYIDPRGLQQNISIPGSTVDLNTAALLGKYAYATQGNPFATSAASLPDPNIERNVAQAAGLYYGFAFGVLGGEALGGALSACRVPAALGGADGFLGNPQSIANASRLYRQLTLQSAKSSFGVDGGLTQEAIDNSRLIIPPEELSNPAIPDGYGKYSTRTFQSPYGDFQTHFYMNAETGDVYYGLDYKSVFNSMSGTPSR